MSELTKGLRKAAYQVRSPRATDVLALCDAHERLEAEVQRLEDVVLTRNAEIARLHIDKDNEHARVCNDFALLVQESGREGRELDRLEGLLRAWGESGWVEGDGTRALWAEAKRLAKRAAILDVETLADVGVVEDDK